MGFSEYYRDVRPVSIGEQRGLIKNGEEKFRDWYGPRKSAKSRVMLIGGFHPEVNDPESIKQVAQAIHPDEEVRTIYLDMNRQPLAAFAKLDTLSPYVQARLEDLPFRPGTIDTVLLEGTLLFMDDSAISRFFQQANRLIAPDGQIFASVMMPLYEPLAKLTLRLRHKVTLYPRSLGKLRKLASPMKLSLYGENEKDPLLIFTRSDSPYLEDLDVPVNLD